MTQGPRTVSGALASAVEYEARLRETEWSGRNQVSRIPNLTVSAAHRITRSLRVLGFSAAEQMECYGILSYRLKGRRPHPLKAASIRIRFDDTPADVQRNRLSQYFRRGCVPTESEWRNRELKCAFWQEDMGDIPLRCSASLEVPVENKALLPQVIREWASAASHLQRLVGVTLRELNGAGVDVSLRHVTRRSFASPAKKGSVPVRIDISATRVSTRGCPFVKSPPPLRYQVEIEYTGPPVRTEERAARVQQELVMWGRHIVAAVLEQRSFRVPPVRRAHDLADLYRTVQERCLSNRRGHRIPFPKPRAIEKALDVCGVRYRTPKADGVTAELMVTTGPDGFAVPYVVTHDSTTGVVVRSCPEGRYRANLRPSAPLESDATCVSARTSLLVGELVQCNNGGATEQMFLVFDALVVDGEARFGLTLEERLEAARVVVERLDHTAAARKAGGMISRYPPFVVMKRFTPIHGGGASLREAYAEEVKPHESYPGVTYRTDGVILMGPAPLHTPGRVPPPVFKWKPSDEQTIDLLVHFDQASGKFAYLCGRRMELRSPQRLEVYTYSPFHMDGLELPTCGSDGKRERCDRCPVVVGASPLGGERIELRIGDGMIVEFRYEKGGGRGGTLRPVRIREDKTARHAAAVEAVRRRMMNETSGERRRRKDIAAAIQRMYPGDHRKRLRYVPLEWVGLLRGGRFSFPDIGANNYDVARATIGLARSPVTLEELDAKAAEIGRTSYFGLRQKKAPSLLAMVRLHNRGKAGLLSQTTRWSTAVEHAQRRSKLRVLDLACGEGNDLPRWKAFGGIATYVGVDRDECAIIEARRRATHARYRPMRDRLRFLSGSMTRVGGFVDPDEPANAGKMSGDAHRGPFHLVTVFNAVHYANTDRPTLVRFLKMVGESLVPGGLAILVYMCADKIGTAMDADGVFEHDGHFRIRQRSATEWDVRLGGIGREITEPKITGKALLKAAEESAAFRPVVEKGLLRDHAPPAAQDRDMLAPEKTLSGAYEYIVLHKQVS